MSSPLGSVACLLPAENLRCIPLNLIQIHTLAIPPVIELFFSLFLIHTTWRSRRVHLLLAADGVFYFILALVDQLLYVLPAARNSVATSRVAELFLGSVSFVPMLLYTSYLAWLSRREFIPYLPRRHQLAAKYLFTGLIPVIGVLDFAASLGMSIQNLSLPRAPLMIDFTNKNESLWLSLCQLSLALYTNYQCLTAFLALYRLCTALFDQLRIDTNNTDERHFVNGTGWIAFGIKVGAVEGIIGFAAGGFAIPLSRRILRLVSRVCMIVGILKGMDKNENFEFLNKELILWRRGKPISTSHSLIANRRMTIRSSQIPDPTREPSSIEKDVELGEADQRATVHDEVGGPPVLHTGMRFSALPPPERAIHADELRRRSDQNTSAEVLTSRNDARRQSAQTIFDDTSVVLGLTPDFPPGLTSTYPQSVLNQGHVDDKFELPALGQQSTRRNTAQSYGEEDAATEYAALYTGEFMEHKPKFPLISIPQSAHARVEGSMLAWTRPVSQQHSGKYPVRFPSRPTQARSTIHAPTAQPEGESSDSLKRRNRQLSSLHLLERASKSHSDVTTHSSQWSTVARSRSPASIRMYDGGMVINPRRASTHPGDFMSPSSAETLRDGRLQIVIDRMQITSADAVIHQFGGQAALNREKALRRLNGEVGV
ncbi:uncharacterized protein F5891DRAFT_83682 [Suillus fuscotomentosus]|uniref:Uncharacterized protein n=1 Tax=Suillus fuscotomentosus TaxID=1912939 RepID=A0AAD4ECP5_9AGAM|nr:uncharacterized protein F5891DRAFT_83682 [Suillus fuscotomentosus]KAG1903727.1 hypothetical protein F5891DRAFT_83682 [Suillus fuscotomentosus]